MQPYEPIRFPDFIETKYQGKAPRMGHYCELTTKETWTYFAWFQEIMPRRIEYLSGRVLSSLEMVSYPTDHAPHYPRGDR